jgi:hypothetical protein
MSSANQQMSPAQTNALARALIKARAVAMEQQIFSQTYNSSNATTQLAVSTPTVTVNPRNVGLIRGFWVKVVATITNGSGVAINRAGLAPSTILSQIQFQDLQNNTRIQTTGWHVAIINSMRARRPFGAAWVDQTGFDSPESFGSNMINQIQAPASIAAGATGQIIMWYWIPLAYSEDDLRGAVYANVVNATMQLNLNFNANPVAAFGGDSTQALYIGAQGGSIANACITTATVTVYQSYLDQLPVGPKGVILPVLDLATIYELKNTTQTAIVPNNDFPVQYANFRDFLSTLMIFVNNGTTGLRTNGSDINYWALQSANFTNLWKKEPGLVALQTRNHLQTDLPLGCWYFGSREKPISTVQYGNMQLVLNASVADAGAYLLTGYEDFALVNTLSMAGSLAAS